MRGVRLPLWLAAALLTALALFAVPQPAAGAPGQAAGDCPSGLHRPRGGPINAVPWAQRWYDPRRLAGIADGTGITVAVIDSGVDAGHPQLRGRVLPGHDYLGAGDGRADCVSHGTEVASIIAARPVTGTSFAGLAPGARILPIRATEATDGSPAGRAGDGAALARAINAAVQAGAQVVNVSMVLYRDDARVRAAVLNATRHDVVLVAAVGNQHGQAAGADPVPYPAAYPGVIGVAAFDNTGQRLSQSQVGPYVDIAAPGAGVTADAAGGGLLQVSGTSFAAPFVSATAALIRSREALPASEVARRITGTADPAPDAPYSERYGHGLLDPFRAVTEVPADRVNPTERPAHPLPASEPHPGGTRPAGRGLALILAGSGLTLAALVLLLANARPRPQPQPRPRPRPVN